MEENKVKEKAKKLVLILIFEGKVTTLTQLDESTLKPHQGEYQLFYDSCFLFVRRKGGDRGWGRKLIEDSRSGSEQQFIRWSCFMPQPISIKRFYKYVKET